MGRGRGGRRRDDAWRGRWLRRNGRLAANRAALRHSDLWGKRRGPPSPKFRRKTKMSKGFYVGLDVGTQSTKGVLLDADKSGPAAIVARASAAYDLIEGLPSGAAEQHPHTWRDAVGTVVRQLLSGVDASKVRGIGVSGQQHGLVV